MPPHRHSRRHLDAGFGENENRLLGRNQPARQRRERHFGLIDGDLRPQLGAADLPKHEFRECVARRLGALVVVPVLEFIALVLVESGGVLLSVQVAECSRPSGYRN
jgi:hypothetical protein